MMITGIILGILQLSLTVKRFHDFNSSGWSVLLLLIPLYNIYLIIKLYFFLGDEGLNDYGDDPLKHQPVSDTRYYVVSLLPLV